MSNFPAKVSPVDRQSMDQVVADRLRDAILSGGFEPGARFTEIDLANKLGVSRSTVRTGLQRLLSEGLVALQPYSGWHVLTLNSQDAWELFTLRSCLEAMASRLAAENIDEQGRVALKESFRKLRSAVQNADDKAIADADLALHALIVSMARHKRLATHYDLVKQQVRLYIASSNAMLESRKQVISNHLELVEAICSGNGTKAARLAREHGASAAQGLFEALQRGQNTLSVKPPRSRSAASTRKADGRSVRHREKPGRRK